MWFHSCRHLNISGNSPPIVKRKDFVSKATGTGVFLWGATSKRDSMWHSPVFTCINPNRIPVEIYNTMGMSYAVMWMQILFLNFFFLVNKTVLMNKVCHTFKWRSSSQILFATETVFVRDKYGQLANCWEFLDAAWQSHILREGLIHLLHLRRFKTNVLVQDILEVTRTINFAAPLGVQSWFNIWENKIYCAILPMLSGMIPVILVDISVWVISESLMLADENFNNPNPIDILLGDNVFFEFRRHDKKTRPRNY